MKDRMGRIAVGALALALAFAAVAPSVAWAQSTTIVRGDECRCVDENGDEIENCHCIRMPEVVTGLNMLRAPRSQIGVMVNSADDDRQDSEGVILREIDEASPAHEAGLRSGDRVVAVNGTSVLEPLDDERERRTVGSASRAVTRFIALVGDLEPGEEATLEYVRDGRRRTTTVVPEERDWPNLFRVAPGEVRVESGDPDMRVFFEREGFPFHRDEDGPSIFFRSPEGEVHAEGWTLGDEGEGIRVLSRSFDPCFNTAAGGHGVFVATDRCMDGVQLQELNPQLAEYFGADEGVLVTEVADESKLGLRAGDVIVSIGGRAVTDAADVRRVLGSYETDEPVVLTVVRKGEEMQLRGTRR